MKELENEPNIKIEKQGLVDDGIYGYKLVSPYSWITFGKSPSNNIFIVFMIGTHDKFRNQGYATKLLDVFFKMIKKANGNIMIESYTSAGEIWIKPVIEKLAKKYGVRLIK